jgi:hypothetical protein
MEQRNCKNCGAPIEHSYNHRCKYCDTLIDFNEPEMNTIQVDPKDLVNLELREIMRRPETNRYVFIFSGYKLQKPKVFEVENGVYVSKVETYVNPPKCSFCIELNKKEVDDYQLPYIENALACAGIDYREIEKLRQQIIDKSYMFGWWSI